MKKLNNKGMTLIELLVSFSIAATIVVSMFNVVINYQKEESIQAIKNDIISYKNTITKIIQTDIIKGGLRSVHLDVRNVNSGGNNSTVYEMIFRFNNRLPYCSGSDNYCKYKNLTIVASNTSENYIMYQDINIRGQKQDVKYSLMDASKGCLFEKESDTCISLQNILKFSSITTNINVTTSGDPSLNSNNNAVKYSDGTIGDNIARYFKLDIAISHPDLGGEYHINLVTPLNYPYCKP